MTAARSHSEMFSPMDAAWWHMEDPTSMTMITGVMTFDGPIDIERLKATLEQRFLTYRRFRQRVRAPRFGLGLPRWEMDPHFDLSSHIHRIALPSPGDQTALEELAGDLMSTPLDYSKPLWQLHIVENCADNKGAMIVRLHHCIADGLALVRVLLSMTDTDPDAPWPQPQEKTERRRDIMTRVLTPAIHAYTVVEHATASAGRLLDEGSEVLTSSARRQDIADFGVSATRAFGKLLLTPPERKTSLKGRTRVPKRAAWSSSVDLADIKAIGRLLDGTVNDVLLAAVAGGLRRYLAARGEPTDGLNLRAMVPVSLRPPEAADKLGNYFGLVILSLPVGIVDPMRRLAVLKRRMDKIKDTPEAMVAYGIVNALGASPVMVEKAMMAFFAAKISAVMTNVPGPREKLYFVGVPLSGLMFWVPTPAQLGLGISIISYAGKVLVGFATDASLVPNPKEIVAGFEAEVAEMQSWLRAAPTPEEVEPAAQTTEPARCQAMTKEGKPCRNRPLPGETTCRTHSRDQ
jgi:diacylglycerol O-acyltransferase / wax synthase